MSKRNPIPVGMTAVTPHLIIAGAVQAIEFYKKAFGAAEEMRLPAPNGKLMHARIRIGGAVVMLVDEMPECNALSPKALNGSPVTLHLYVEDVDAVFARAVKAGAAPVMPAADMFWGDRYAVVVDPFGHTWSIATHQRDLSDEELKQAMEKACATA